MLRVIIFLCVGLAAIPAHAGEPAALCAGRDTVMQRLAKDFSEKPTAMGLASNGNVIELFNNGSGGTWTIVMTLPNGQSCLVAAGEGWESVGTQTVKGPGV